eukprot:TRINITY_DN2306_c0_g2_i1.p2 TRINITY_DN2306_c0_g2~~TRINITY_DN2306_c0_g2_i1.p2  ORF type:complete len:227 (+),score=66.82 TRINITY_DN2306_c0_g2_i1:66-683(+)
MAADNKETPELALHLNKSSPCYPALSSFFVCLHENSTGIAVCQPHFSTLRECEARVPERKRMWDVLLNNKYFTSDPDAPIIREPGILSHAMRKALPQVFNDEDDTTKTHGALTKASRAVLPQVFEEEDDVEKQPGMLSKAAQKVLPQVFDESAPRKQTFLSKSLQAIAPQIFKDADDDDDDDDGKEDKNGKEDEKPNDNAADNSD